MRTRRASARPASGSLVRATIHSLMAVPPAQVLLRDPDLAGTLEGERLRRAERDLVAATAVAFEGPWEAAEESESVRGGIGLLLLEGLIVRRVGQTGRYGAELLGPGDLMRPWQDDGEDVSLPFDTSFRVVDQALLALLDRRFAARAAPYPEVAGALIGRAMQRSRTLVVTMAIAHYPRIDRRLLMLMWHLADRWGRVTPEGIRVPLRLTHQQLADLVASRRPSVSSGLQRLVHEGLISRHGEDWLLHGEPPRDLYEVDRAAHER
jgi:CRP/FNR family transcriptional regulator, cyclic AMP receptor protein